MDGCLVLMVVGIEVGALVVESEWVVSGFCAMPWGFWGVEEQFVVREG